MPDVLVIGLGEGANLFWKVAGSVGLARAECDTLALGSHVPPNHPARVVVLVGAEALRGTIGRPLSIDKARGYVFEPSDCLPSERKVKRIVGEYKTTRSKDGVVIHSKGDPKWGNVAEVVPPSLPSGTRWIIPVLDPRSIMEQGLRPLPALKADLARVREALREDFRPAQIAFSPCSPGRIEPRLTAIDIETVGHTRVIERIGAANIAADNTVRVWSSAWGEDAKRSTREIFEKAPCIVGHNLAFDLPRLGEEGISWGGKNLFDTMLAAHLIQPDLYKGLEKVASLYLDLRPWKHLSDSEPEVYNATDVAVTLQLAVKQAVVLEQTGMDTLFFEKLMPALPVLIGMTGRGLRVDRERALAWQKELLSKQKDLVEVWVGHAPNVNPLSPSQVAGFLYRTLGLPTQTRGGRQTVDEEAVKNLSKHFPERREMLDALLALKKVSKLIGTYAEAETSVDGCVHPNYLPHSKDTDTGAAGTGRLAASDPDIQNQPVEARKLYVPHHPGWWFLEADFSQIEVRIAAALSGDRELQEAVKEDLHGRTMELLGCDRVRAKNVTFGSLYGAGPRKLQTLLWTKAGIDLSYAECKSLQDRLAGAYPRLWAWRAEVVAEGTARTFLTNAFGRRRYFYGRDKQAPAMMNFLPQSNAADILWSLLPESDEMAEDFGGHLVTTVHDSLLFEFPTRERVMEDAVREVLTREFPMIAPGFRVPVELKWGRNWGEMEKV